MNGTHRRSARTASAAARRVETAGRPVAPNERRERADENRGESAR